VTDEAIAGWGAARRSTPGGQATYSDSAIQTCLMLRSAFKLALRQGEGLMNSVVELLGCKLAVPPTTPRSAAGRSSCPRLPGQRCPMGRCTW
jgi:hypothetical protein